MIDYCFDLFLVCIILDTKKLADEDTLTLQCKAVFTHVFNQIVSDRADTLHCERDGVKARSKSKTLTSGLQNSSIC